MQEYFNRVLRPFGHDLYTTIGKVTGITCNTKFLCSVLRELTEKDSLYPPTYMDFSKYASNIHERVFRNHLI